MNKNLFLSFEGNHWFERNYMNLDIKNDVILKQLQINNHHEKIILEIGCSNGWRLNEFYKQNSNNKYIGIEPSEKAIEFGRKNYPNIELYHSTCDEIPIENDYCDIILIPFVFMYIDRKLLFKSVYEIDRILKNKGLLIITDFYSNIPRKNSYKHIENTFIYKLSYFQIFLSSQNYFLNKLESFSHSTSNDKDNYDDMCFYVELNKDLF